jgi:acyl-coenzyme A thioesterase PaaI-like protein
MKHKIAGKQPNSKMCFVCGLKNPLGLKASFYKTENKELIALVKPSELHQSYPGRLHGGVATAILDETIGRAIMMNHEDEVWGVTLEFTAKFRKQITLDTELKVIGRITKETNRSFEGTAEIVLPDGEIAVTGEGKYLRMPIEKISNFDRDENEWRVVRTDNEPDEIEV